MVFRGSKFRLSKLKKENKKPNPIKKIKTLDSKEGIFLSLQFTQDYATNKKMKMGGVNRGYADKTR